jgi:arginine repressor
MKIKEVVKQAVRETILMSKRLTNEQIVEKLQKQGIQVSLCKRLSTNE